MNADAGELEIDDEELEQLKTLGHVPDSATREVIQSDLLQMNAFDYHPRLDRVAVSVPEVGAIWILDHSTTTGEARGSSGDVTDMAATFSTGGEIRKFTGEATEPISSSCISMKCSGFPMDGRTPVT